jgi:L,D-transpeptidase catalytic domain
MKVTIGCDMLPIMKRRTLLTGGLAAGASLTAPARALAQLTEPAAVASGADPLAEVFDRTFAQPSSNTPYERRVAEAAQRERDRAGSKLWRGDQVAIADFARPSSLPRFHFVNMESGKVRSFLVAHGKGSDHEHDGWLKNFSNTPGSEATSRGAYLTCEWYSGKYGTSIRLQGLDADNSNALDRAIVMHPAWYVDLSMAEKFGKIGRSEGCFAMSPVDFNEALWNLSGGRLLFADRIGEA